MTAAHELVPIADRVGMVRWLRFVMAAGVVVGAVAGATPVAVPLPLLAAVTLLYAVGLASVEELSQRRAGRWTGLLGLSLLLDGLYLAWAGAVTGGTQGIVAWLLIAHVVGVTLLVSYPTGVKVALWHSLLLYGAAELHRLDVLELAGLGTAPYRWLVAYVVGLWLVGLGTASFSAVNERELRRRRVDLEALAAFAAEVNQAPDPESVAEALAGQLRDALGFTRVVVLGGRGGREVLGAAGVAAPSRHRDPAPSAVVARACRENRPVLSARLAPDEDAWLRALLPDARNVVVLPLSTGADAPEAVVAEYGTQRGTRIERRALDAAGRFADHGALALRAARLLAEVRLAATRDGLTGIANRSVFDEELATELSRAMRSGEPLALLLLDIDHFKAINDEHGHPFADGVLRGVAQSLAEESRDFDTVARYGGEEFAVILPNSDEVAAYAAGERLRKAVEAADLGVAVTVSVGAAVARTPASFDGLVERADAALYASKHAGRNQVTLAPAG